MLLLNVDVGALSYFGHITSRSSSLEKSLLLEKGGRKYKKRIVSSKLDGHNYSGNDCTVGRPE